MANIDPAFIKLTPVGELETKPIPENTDEFLIYDEDGELKKSNWGAVFELATGGLTKKTTDVQHGDKIIKKFLGYLNPDGSVNPLDQSEINKYISIYGGYTDDPDEALDYAPEPGQNGKSAYEVAVENGFTGSYTDWYNSLKGTNGVNASAHIPDYSEIVFPLSSKSSYFYNGKIYQVNAGQTLLSTDSPTGPKVTERLSQVVNNITQIVADPSQVFDSELMYNDAFDI